MTGPMQVSDSARAVLRLGTGVLVLAALAGVWETLAAQAPGSPLYIGVLPGPVELLRESALSCGILIVLAGLVLGERSWPRKLIPVLLLAVVLTLGAGLYAAASGMHGVQARDLRPDATWVFAIKYTGRALLTACLIDLARRGLASVTK
jgi:hypothetical protein